MSIREHLAPLLTSVVLTVVLLVGGGVWAARSLAGTGTTTPVVCHVAAVERPLGTD